MPVDLILSDASLLRQQYNHQDHDLVAKHVAPDYGLIRGLGYLDYFGIEIKHYPDEDNHWAMGQLDYFKFCDLVLMCNVSSIFGGTIDKTDVRHWRPVIGKTKNKVSESLVLMSVYGINDDNAYIDNYYNAFFYNDDAVKRMLHMADDYLEDRYEITRDRCRNN